MGDAVGPAGSHPKQALSADLPIVPPRWEIRLEPLSAVLFPSLPPGGVRTGMEWTDTTTFRSGRMPSTQPSMGSRAIARWTATIRGPRRLLSWRATGLRANGKGRAVPAAAGESGPARGPRPIPQPGCALISARGSDAGDMTISIPPVGQTVPVKQAGSYTITAIRLPKR